MRSKEKRNEEREKHRSKAEEKQRKARGEGGRVKEQYSGPHLALMI